MAAPSTGYDKATMDNPGGALTDFSLLIDLSTMSSDWWIEQDDADATKGRAFKDDGSTELPVDWIDFDAGAETGWARVSWDGTMASSGTQTVRLYPPNSANAAVAASATFGSDNAYASHWVGYWADGGETDRTSNGNDGTGTGSPSFNSATGQVGGATDYESDTPQFSSISSAWASTNTFSILAWVNPETLNGNFRGPCGNESGVRLYTDYSSATGRLTLFNGSLIVQADVGDALSTATWEHVAATGSAIATELYIAGANIKSGASTTGAGPIRIGRGTSETHNYDGIIDEIQMHDAELSADWIAHERAQGNDQAAFWNHAGSWEFTAAAVGDPEGPLIGGKLVGRGILSGRLVA